jgi:uncharacterized protein (TIGR03083 family)
MTSADLPVIDTRHLFAAERSALLALLETLTSEQWQLPTVCPGWTVLDVALHLLWVDISNISRRRDQYFGRPQDTPSSLDDLPTLIAFVNQLNDNWIVGARRMSPELLVTLLRVTGEAFSTYVQTVDIHAMGDSIGWAGPDPAPVWLDIAREFTERWVHQQHIRDAAGIPGAIEPEFLSPVLATFAVAIPFALRDIDAEEGSTAQLVITGESGGIWTAVRISGGWQSASSAGRTPITSVTIDQETAWRLFTRGVSPEQAREASQLAGDHSIAETLLHMVTILA